MELVHDIIKFESRRNRVGILSADHGLSAFWASVHSMGVNRRGCLATAPPSQLLHGQRRQTSLAHEAGVLGQANRLELADGDGGQRQSGECD